jgi:transposase-like protein
LSSGRNVPQIAAELGVSISNLRRWKRDAITFPADY